MGPRKANPQSTAEVTGPNSDDVIGRGQENYGTIRVSVSCITGRGRIESDRTQDIIGPRLTWADIMGPRHFAWSYNFALIELLSDCGASCGVIGRCGFCVCYRTIREKNIIGLDGLKIILYIIVRRCCACILVIGPRENYSDYWLSGLTPVVLYCIIQ